MQLSGKHKESNTLHCWWRTEKKKWIEAKIPIKIKMKCVEDQWIKCEKKNICEGDEEWGKIGTEIVETQIESKENKKHAVCWFIPKPCESHLFCSI